MWAASSGDDQTIQWVGQLVTLAVAILAGVFALRGKRVDVNEARRAKFDERVDKELDDALRRIAELERRGDEITAAYDVERRLRLRFEAMLYRHNLDPYDRPEAERPPDQLG